MYLTWSSGRRSFILAFRLVFWPLLVVELEESRTGPSTMQRVVFLANLGLFPPPGKLQYFGIRGLRLRAGIRCPAAGLLGDIGASPFTDLKLLTGYLTLKSGHHSLTKTGDGHGGYKRRPITMMAGGADPPGSVALCDIAGFLS